MYRAAYFVWWYCVSLGFLFVTSYGKIIAANTVNLNVRILVEIEVKIPLNHSYSSMNVVGQTFDGS